MKKLGTLAIILTLAGITFVSLQGCKEKTSSPTGSKTSSLGASAEPNSFKEVTSKLDAGGSLYMYLGTEQWLKGLSGKVDKWHEMIAGLPDVQENRQDVDNAFNTANRVIKDSGLEDISGFGMSSIALEPGFYRNKIIVHHYAGQGNGFLWSMFGQKPHELDGLNLLPANTAMAAFYDVDTPQIWSVIQKECEQSGFPQAQEALKEFTQEFEKGAGMKWDDLMNSLGDEFGMVMTLDDSRMVQVPMPGQQLQIPDPAFMLVVKVKNDAIFNRLDALLKEKKVPGVASVDQNGLRMRTMQVPIPVAMTLRPSIATSGGYLFISTSDALVQEALAVKGGKAGLKATDEFKKLSRDIPLQGNQFAFLSQRFGQTFMKLQQQALAAKGQVPPEMEKLVQSFIQPDKAAYTFAVGANTDEGWITVANGNQSGGNLLAASAVAPTAIMAAMALPAFAKAKSRAQTIACINNLRMIDAAKQQWALEKSKNSTDVPTWEDLKPYLGSRADKAMSCPGGGHYTLNALDQKPTCSMPGHKLP